MTIVAMLIVFGALLVYAGWKDLSMGALLRGDNSKPKARTTG